MQQIACEVMNLIQVYSSFKKIILFFICLDSSYTSIFKSNQIHWLKTVLSKEKISELFIVIYVRSGVLIAPDKVNLPDISSVGNITNLIPKKLPFSIEDSFNVTSNEYYRNVRLIIK